METVVVVTAAIGRPSPIVRALRGASFRVTLRDLAAPLGDVVLDSPDMVFLDPPEDADLGALAAELVAAAGLGGVPVVALVTEAQLGKVVGTASLADFCVRPLREAELVARVRRLVRRPGRDDDDKIRVGELVVDLRGYEASLSDQALDLTYQEFELLKFLASHPGQAFTRDQLLERVWGYDYYGGSRTVDIHVRRIRAKLGHGYASCIKTIRHVGYKWAADACPA